MPFTQQTIQQIAAQRFAKEEAQRKAEEEMAVRENAAAAAALAEAERLARIRAEQEREEARLRAERALAEERVRAEAAALEAAVEAELQRLRNRSEVEVLRDEVAELKKTVAHLSAPKPRICVVSSPAALHVLNVVANNSNLGGDPHYGVGKVLRVTYKFGDCGMPQSIAVDEHQTLNLKGHELHLLSASWETNPNRRAPQFFKADVLSWLVGHINQLA
jgi:hypothetical protein